MYIRILHDQEAGDRWLQGWMAKPRDGRENADVEEIVEHVVENPQHVADLGEDEVRRNAAIYLN